MIVVGIIGLLAAIAIPKYGDLIEKANLGATVGNLASMRSALSIYTANYQGLPGTIDTKKQPLFNTVMDGDNPFVKANFPSNASPYGNSITVGAIYTCIPTGAGSGWFYNNNAGNIYINSTANDIKGIAYTTY
jgi:type II secretory pathway pseudopilin PulG